MIVLPYGEKTMTIC